MSTKKKSRITPERIALYEKLVATIPDIERKGADNLYTSINASFAIDPPPVFAIVWRDDVQVFFNGADQPVVPTPPAEGAPDVYLRVTGVDALAEELRTRSADIIDGRKTECMDNANSWSRTAMV